MSHQMDNKNFCHGRCSFIGFERNLLNRMMTRFEGRWFIVIIGEVYRLVWNETSHLYFSAAEQISLYHKKNKTKNNGFVRCSFCC